ncbi:tyrosine-type recombinase/integrase [Neobacillus sp. SAB-20_R2A]|uniref:tyrosine-type recombinase/integrase n=1 Tax=Neobacillus sp. SAB-20_R2A TaxID=3120519 RepID=UPI003C6E71E0
MERQYGYPIVIKTFQNRMARLLRIASLNAELTPHSLRHTHTSLLAEAGVSLEQIMDRLGHTRLSDYEKCIPSRNRRNEKRSLPKVQ